MITTKTSITKTNFTITLDSIINNYRINMMEFLQILMKDENEDPFYEELDEFNANIKRLREGNIQTIKRLFGGGSTSMLLSALDFDSIEQAEKDKEFWEILVVNDIGMKVVCLNRDEVLW